MLTRGVKRQRTSRRTWQPPLALLKHTMGMLTANEMRATARVCRAWHMAADQVWQSDVVLIRPSDDDRMWRRLCNQESLLARARITRLIWHAQYFTEADLIGTCSVQEACPRLRHLQIEPPEHTVPPLTASVITFPIATLQSLVWMRKGPVFQEQDFIHRVCQAQALQVVDIRGLNLTKEQVLAVVSSLHQLRTLGIPLWSALSVQDVENFVGKCASPDIVDWRLTMETVSFRFPAYADLIQILRPLVARYPNIESLQLEGAPGECRGTAPTALCECLQPLRNLRVVVIHVHPTCFVSASAKSFQQTLPAWPLLEEFVVEGIAEEITLPLAEQLNVRCPHLRRVQLNHSPQRPDPFGDKSIARFVRCHPNLEVLPWLWQGSWLPQVIPHATALLSFHSSERRPLESDELRLVLRHCRRLRNLHVAVCVSWTDEHCQQLGRLHPLRSLRLVEVGNRSWSAWSEAGWEELAQSCPSLEDFVIVDGRVQTKNKPRRPLGWSVESVARGIASLYHLRTFEVDLPLTKMDPTSLTLLQDAIRGRKKQTPAATHYHPPTVVLSGLAWTQTPTSEQYARLASADFRNMCAWPPIHVRF
jgi:hypothetical protein